MSNSCIVFEGFQRTKAVKSSMCPKVGAAGFVKGYESFKVWALQPSTYKVLGELSWSLKLRVGALPS